MFISFWQQKPDPVGTAWNPTHCRATGGWRPGFSSGSFLDISIERKMTLKNTEEIVLPLTELETERHKLDQENKSMTDPRQAQAQVLLLLTSQTQCGCKTKYEDSESSSGLPNSQGSMSLGWIFTVKSRQAQPTGVCDITWATGKLQTISTANLPLTHNHHPRPQVFSVPARLSSALSLQMAL